jgi:hypothetical protein
MKRAGVALLLIIVWTTGLLGGTLFGWWRRPLSPSDDPNAFMRAVIPLIDQGNRANTALVLIEKGAIRECQEFGVRPEWRVEPLGA